MAGVGLWVVLMTGRVTHVEVDLPHDQPGDTWVLVGSDSRERLDTDAPYLIGDDSPRGEEPPDGARADIVMVLHRDENTTKALAIPRDVLVGSGSGAPTRLALTLDPDPQVLVDALCADLGIATDHLVIMDMEGLIDLVDSMGGIDVELDRTVTDQAAGLDLRAGPQRLDGEAALALVRSRNAVELQGRRWVVADDGAQRRIRSSTQVFTAMRRRAESLWRDPVALTRSAWVAAGAVTLNDATTISDLAALRAPETTVTLPTEGDTGIRALTVSDDARDFVSRVTGSTRCRS